MTVREIPLSSWPEFLDSFSRQHHGWLVTITRDDTSLVNDEPLDFAHADGRGVTIRAGDRDIRIDNANEIAVTSTADESAIGHVAIIAPHETLTIRFREVIPPEQVDGIAS